MQNSKSKLKFQNLFLLAIFIFIFLVFGLKPEIGEAVKFSLSPIELIVNQETTVLLTINTEGEEINAVELKLKFLAPDFLIKDISDANSIISLWVERPNFSNEKGEISFSGIIPGGYPGIISENYQSKEGQLLKIILIPKKVDQLGFQIEAVKVLLNDGKGTEAKLSTSNLKFSVTQEGPSILIPAKDEDPPELFTPEISQNPDVFEGKWFLVFTTQDKGSGMDHYEVLETEQRGSIRGLGKKEKWQVGESPYLLKDQKLKSYIYVKAIDKAGNERVEMLAPQKPLLWYENYSLFGIIILGIIILYLIGKILWKRYLRPK